jgi:hydroxyacylglutathione hydrolase
MAETEAKPRKRASKTETAKVVREYFEELGAGTPDAPLRHYAEDGRAVIYGVTPEMSREELADYFRSLWDAFPDFRIEITEILADGDSAAIHWDATGTFAGPGTFQGLEPNGARVSISGVDVAQVKDGRVKRIVAYTDNATIARQLGTLPPQASRTEERLIRLANARTRMGRFMTGKPEEIADGVWIIRGGFPQKTMNVYFVRDGDGVMVFDAGIRSMTNGVAAAGVQLGGITRVLLGHGHQDHRGVAPGLGVPVLCHPADREFAEGDGGFHTFDFSKLRSPLARLLMPRLLRIWDGGPVEIADTVLEGDEIAGFRVVHLPGHAPGLIALWRESDRLALCTDCFYTLDPETGRKGDARVPHPAFNYNTEQARESMRKLAALEPAAAWPGHAEPLTGDVRAQLERAADTT